MAADDDIVLKIVIKGQDPSEITRLANETAGRLADESAKHIGKMTDLHKKAAQDQENATKEATDSEIKDAQRLQEAIKKVEAQRNASMDAMLNRMKNVTIIAQGLIQAFEGQVRSFISLGNEIDKVVNVYGSLKGGIDEIREASKGEIADIDIISAKNRAFALDLHLTDTQFGIVAAAADRFADSIGGTSTKEKFDTLIQGLTTGRAKTLLAGGVMEDTTKVVEDYAKAHHTVSEALTEEAKKIAVAEDALRSMDKKLIESGVEVDNFAHEWERTSAVMQNTWDHILLGLGQFLIGIEQGFEKIPAYLKIGVAKIKDQIMGGTQHYEEQARAELGRQLEQYERDQDTIVEKARARQKSADAYTIPMRGPNIDAKKAAKLSAAALSQEYYPNYNRAVDENGDELPTTRAGQYDKDQALLDIIGATDYQHRMGGMDSGDMDAEYQKVANRTGHSPFDQSMGFNADKLAEQMAKVQPRIDQLKKEAGDRGIFGILMFGPDGPDQLYSEMDEFQKTQSDMADMLTETAHKMAEAGAASLAAWTANTQGAKKSFRDVTNELATALSTEAYLKGLEAVAKAIGFAASEDYVGAEKSLAEAAAWGALGAAAGLGARAIGHSSAASTSTGTSTKTGSAGGYGGYTKSSTSGSGNNAPLTINLSVFPGGEAEAGRQINKALDAYYSQTGKGARAAA